MAKKVQRFNKNVYIDDKSINEELSNNNTEGLELNNFKLLILFAFFAFFYITFLALSDTIHQLGNKHDLTDINRWFWDSAKENDGIELYVMTLSMPLYILACFF